MRNRCHSCGKELDSLVPFECKRCGELFCAHHQLPENHNCPNLTPTKPLVDDPDIPIEPPSPTTPPIIKTKRFWLNNKWKKILTILSFIIILIILNYYSICYLRFVYSPFLILSGVLFAVTGFYGYNIANRRYRKWDREHARWVMQWTKGTHRTKKINIEKEWVCVCLWALLEW